MGRHAGRDVSALELAECKRTRLVEGTTRAFSCSMRCRFAATPSWRRRWAISSGSRALGGRTGRSVVVGRAGQAGVAWKQFEPVQFESERNAAHPQRHNPRRAPARPRALPLHSARRVRVGSRLEPAFPGGEATDEPGIDVRHAAPRQPDALGDRRPHRELDAVRAGAAGDPRRHGRGPLRAG